MTLTTPTLRRALPLALALGVLPAGPAWSATTPEPAPVAAPAVLASVRPLGPEEDPGAVAIPPLDVATETSWTPRRLHATWPAVPGATALAGAVRAQVRRRIAQVPTAMWRTGSELTTTWSVVADHAGLVGVRLRTEQSGTHAAPDSTTVYGTRDGRAVWRGPDLITPQGRARVVAAVHHAVRPGRRAAAPVRPGPVDAILDDVAFTRQGGLQLVVPAPQARTGGTGRVLVTLDRPTTDRLLSPAGRRVRDAVVRSTPASADATDRHPTSPVPAARPATDCRKVRCLALTFDDGPGKHTPAILDTLVAHKARATFFTLGPAVKAAPGTMRRMHRLGMAVGNHTWTHRQLTRLPARTVTEEITRTTKAIRSATGTAPVAVRPPYGAFDRRTPHAGYPFVLWDVDTEDWKNRDAATTTRRALAGARRGSIILMHDIHPSTARALPGIVKGLQRQGYTLVTVPELLGRTDPTKAYYSGPRH
ncbi:polysaccharide deacetylase family protein [Arsenicicoccus dermatophilus]|uniref:polysaccharide deacetylase family protein n=1 Tax=Arsenicicoccus dermatophilus TaxID=1076331 RepID=UPI00391721C1